MSLDTHVTGGPIVPVNVASLDFSKLPSQLAGVVKNIDSCPDECGHSHYSDQPSYDHTCGG